MEMVSAPAHFRIMLVAMMSTAALPCRALEAKRSAVNQGRLRKESKAI